MEDAKLNMEEICARYRKLYGGVVYDVLEHRGFPNQVLAHEMTPLKWDMKLAGPAFTVRGIPTSERDESRRYKRLQMVKEMTSPCIEVREGGASCKVAIYGELSAATAKAHGAAGAVIDGGTRDSMKLIEIGFPLFARYRNPVEAFGRWAVLEYQVPIMMSGELIDMVPVHPGDLIFGDLDGVIVIPKQLTVEVLLEAEKIAAIEDLAREEFKQGKDPVEVFDRHKRL